MSLFTDLQSAGLPVVSATDTPGNPRQATFSRSLNDDEDEIYLNLLFPFRQIQKQRKAAAKPYAKSIPNWSTWTQEQWQSYWDANLSDPEVDLVTSLAAVRVMQKRQNAIIKAQGKALIALRDEIWSDLPE